MTHNLNMRTVIVEAFKRTGLSILQVAKRTGLPYATAHLAVSGEGNMTLRVVERLAPVLNLELVIRKRRK